MIFLDTSAVYALADRDDLHHEEARHLFEAALRAGETFLVHSYILVESAALLQRRLGWEAAERFLREARAFYVRWVDEDLHRRAVERFAERRGRVSLVDEVSFLAMREAGIRRFLAFDEDFLREGFEPYRPL